MYANDRVETEAAVYFSGVFFWRMLLLLRFIASLVLKYAKKNLNT